MKKEISPQTLYEKALKQAKSSSLEELFTKTQLPISWLRKFRQSSIPAPSVHRIETILRAFDLI